MERARNVIMWDFLSWLVDPAAYRAKKKFEAWYNKIIGETLTTDGAPYGNTNAAKNHIKKQKQASPKKIRGAKYYEEKKLEDIQHGGKE